MRLTFLFLRENALDGYCKEDGGGIQKEFSFFGALLKTSHYAALFFQIHSQTNTPTRRQQLPLGGGVVCSTHILGQGKGTYRSRCTIDSHHGVFKQVFDITAENTG